jgi:hypothetical protein
MGVTDARLISGRPTEVGARAREHVRFGRGRPDQELVVSASVPGRTIAWRMVEGGPFVGEVALDLETIGPAATRARWSGSFRLTGWRRILEPLVAGEAKAGEAAELQRLKAVLEATGSR